jgi:polyphosphate glucokinase
MVVNDADAAGLAEVSFGAGKNVRGVVMMVTVGTGLGTALFVDGKLVPNTELGHIEIDGQDAELSASDAARQRDNLSWAKWAKRFDLFLGTLERLFWPDLFILGGGVVSKADRFLPLLNLRSRVVVAEMGNNAGIVGAAMAAKSLVS